MKVLVLLTLVLLSTVGCGDSRSAMAPSAQPIPFALNATAREVNGKVVVDVAWTHPGLVDEYLGLVVNGDSRWDFADLRTGTFTMTQHWEWASVDPKCMVTRGATFQVILYRALDAQHDKIEVVQTIPVTVL